MFVELDKKTKETLKGNGKLGLRIIPSAGIYDYHSNMRYVVVYEGFSSSSTLTHPIFSFVLTRINSLYIADSVKMAKEAKMSEEWRYLFLDWLLGTFPDWAKQNRKKTLMITTELPHCTELFVKNGYALREVKDYDTEIGYRGYKNLEEVG
jgi:hypothetical protein